VLAGGDDVHLFSGSFLLCDCSQTISDLNFKMGYWRLGVKCQEDIDDWGFNKKLMSGAEKSIKRKGWGLGLWGQEERLGTGTEVRTGAERSKGGRRLELSVHEDGLRSEAERSRGSVEDWGWEVKRNGWGQGLRVQGEVIYWSYKFMMRGWGLRLRGQEEGSRTGADRSRDGEE